MEDYSLNQRHKIIVSNGIIILSVPRVSGSLRKNCSQMQISLIFFLSNIPQCDNNQATSKFESHVPSIKKKRGETFLSISTTSHREIFKFTKMTRPNLIILSRFSWMTNYKVNHCNIFFIF